MKLPIIIFSVPQQSTFDCSGTRNIIIENTMNLALKSNFCRKSHTTYGKQDDRPIRRLVLY